MKVVVGRILGALAFVGIWYVLFIPMFRENTFLQLITLVGMIFLGIYAGTLATLALTRR
jgi:hypothetical protein